MELNIREEKNVTIIVPEGALDDEARVQFNEHLHPLAARAESRLLIDLSQTPRITSNGLGALVSLVAWANAHGARVVLCSPSALVFSVFKATRLDSYLEILPTAAEARSRLLA